jgi:hypothetical protein
MYSASVYFFSFEDDTNERNEKNKRNFAYLFANKQANKKDAGVIFIKDNTMCKSAFKLSLNF